MASASVQTPTGESAQVDLSTIPISPDGGNTDENKKPNGENGAQEQITVFHDKDNFNVKHPLMHRWTLWFTKPPSGKVGLRKRCFTFEFADF
jgi:translation initiation factor 4E